MGANQSRKSILEEAKRYTDEKLAEKSKSKEEKSSNDVSLASKDAYDSLYAKHEALLNTREPIRDVQSRISDEAIDKFVKTLIEDPKTNIYGFPDVVEGAVYRNVLKTMLHAVSHVTDDSNVLFLGHKIRIIIEPAVLEEGICQKNEVTDKGKEEL